MMMQFSDAERAELLQTFRTQAAELLAALEEGLLTLERAPQDDEALHAVFRAAHTIKGDARIVGLEDVALAAHALEDVLEQLRERTLAPVPGLISALLAVGDALRAMIFSGTRPEHHVAIEALALSAQMARAEIPDEASVAEGIEVADRAAAQSQARTLRVDVTKLDRMLDLAGEIAIARGRVARLLESLPPQLAREALEAHHETDRLHFELQEQVMRARMVEIGSFLRLYARTVRESALATGKEATLVIDGGDVEVDTRVLELLRDPLAHMIRNAVDHGIESPEVRAAFGKPVEGQVSLTASHEGGQIVLRLRDDGAGLDTRRIAERAREMGLVATPEALPRAELLKLIFAPGFSTAASVTDLSGRGVGMDVVRRNVEALRGSIELESTDGVGACVIIRLPLTLAIIDGFSVEVAEETYVLPLHAVVECLALPAERSEDGEGRGVLTSRGEPLPFVRLRALFGETGELPWREHVVVVEQEGHRVGLVVDELHGEGQAVIKALGRMLGGLPALAGSTILGNGRVGLIIDVPALVLQALRPVELSAR
jgi:two-component system chemotaxis sensor kinase CheA